MIKLIKQVKGNKERKRKEKKKEKKNDRCKNNSQPQTIVVYCLAAILTTRHLETWFHNFDVICVGVDEVRSFMISLKSRGSEIK